MHLSFDPEIPVLGIYSIAVQVQLYKKHKMQ